MRLPSILLTDFYKVGHIFQYPENTTKVYSNLTPRNSRIPGTNDMVFFGLQYFIKKYLIEDFKTNFFDIPLDEIMDMYKNRVNKSLFHDLPSYKHIEDLHRLGYLPIEIKALKEGSLVPMRIPCLTIENTKPEFFWLTNFIESLLSAIIWQPCTSATIAHLYKKILSKHAIESGVDLGFVQWQGHDFSFRGMSSLDSAITSGMGHLLSFYGTDTIPAIEAIEYYYTPDNKNTIIGGSVNATEHSVMCAGTKEDERGTYRRLINDIYPSGILSIVSDTYDLFEVCTDIIPSLKNDILSRDGKVVLRPDSGDPVKIICGDYDTEPDSPAYKGVVQLLYETFGGTKTEEGYIMLDSHIGVIYGDSITMDRARRICDGLMEKGFASQAVFGIGSYTYQYNTRDTFGMAMKATYVEVNGEGRLIYKDPKTDDGVKKSARGMLKVVKNGNTLKLVDQLTPSDDYSDDLLELVFKDGVMHRIQSIENIREILEGDTNEKS